ncbi:protease modulator HflC [Aquibaculum sediminis]|uniref:protease modulator HflC n=1 Tax=Aquibaculum sediminis TaxID=3231907 RepID=UPI00345234FF
MKARFLVPLAILLGGGLILLLASLFTVQQTQQALVLQFGEPRRVITEPGLKFKIPFIQNVLYYERRVLNLDPPTQRVLLTDQKPLLVDSYARYRISDPLRFYQAVRTEATAASRLGSIVNATMRGVLGNVTLASVLSDERVEIMNNIRDQVNDEVSRFGIEIVDVRIRRSDLPDETSQAVYDRMQSEREREAAEFRAQGFEQAQRIRASADREATVIRAEATRESEILRGQGEAERTTTLSEAFGRDAEFFEFYRSMQAYVEAIDGDNSLLVLPPDNDFFRYFNQAGGANAPQAAQRAPLLEDSAPAPAPAE